MVVFDFEKVIELLFDFLIWIVFYGRFFFFLLFCLSLVVLYNFGRLLGREIFELYFNFFNILLYSFLVSFEVVENFFSEVLLFLLLAL